MTTVSTEHGPSVEELLPGEAEAFAIAVNQAATQLGKTGKIRPVLIAVRCENGVPAMLWDMEISSAVARGLEGLQELALIVRRLLSPQGCDLSEMGMPREHWKADGVILVAEGLGVQVDGIAPQSQEPGGVTLNTPLRMLSLEYRVGDRSAVMLYRMDPQGTNRLHLNQVARGPGRDTPLLTTPPTVQ
ncbi:MAG: hypothetical protein E6R08_00565 [Nevskiaceae bacterium]|nr:MAG: hypothetical protein E6R08_00565 [Nevskiaceae bacterium]